MDDKEILSKAIDKAIANGWKLSKAFDNEKIRLTDHLYKDDFQEVYLLKSEHHNYHFELFSIIFSHSFLKAFFGLEPYFGLEYHSLSKSGLRDYIEGGADKIPNWKFRGFEMLEGEDPIKYLERFL